MSIEHARRLKLVRREREAAEEALEKAWRYGSSSPRYYRCDVDDIRLAFLHVEKTYYIRLVAEAEAMLFRHLVDHWPTFDFPEDDGAARLVNHCRHRLSPRKLDSLPNDLADEAIEAIAWRNHLAHGEKGSPPPRVTYNDGYDRLYDLLLLLPSMKGSHADE
jgi:hypothetical protein